MATFRLRILTMGGVVFDGDVLSVLVPTEEGPLLIEPGYTNYIGSLKKPAFCGR